MTSTIRAYVAVLYTETLAAGLWLLGWTGLALLGSADASASGGGDVSDRDAAVLVLLFTGLPAVVIGSVMALLARGTARRARWVPAVGTGAHALLLLVLLAAGSLVYGPLRLMLWTMWTLCLVALVLPVTPGGRAWFRVRRSHDRVTGCISPPTP